MAAPNPSRRISIAPHQGSVTVRFGAAVVAKTDRALVLHEGSYPVVHYVPREDVDETVLERTAHTTHCPYKGDANYFSIRDGDRLAENAAWTYESPIPEVLEIKNALAFYTNKVSVDVA